MAPADNSDTVAPCPPITAEPLVFLNDNETFTNISGCKILLGNYDRAYDINKMLELLTAEQLAQCQVTVVESMVNAANEGLE